MINFFLQITPSFIKKNVHSSKRIEKNNGKKPENMMIYF